MIPAELEERRHLEEEILMRLLCFYTLASPEERERIEQMSPQRIPEIIEQVLPRDGDEPVYWAFLFKERVEGLKRSLSEDYGFTPVEDASDRGLLRNAVGDEVVLFQPSILPIYMVFTRGSCATLIRDELGEPLKRYPEYDNR